MIELLYRFIYDKRKDLEKLTTLNTILTKQTIGMSNIEEIVSVHYLYPYDYLYISRIYANRIIYSLWNYRGKDFYCSDVLTKEQYIEMINKPNRFKIK
jgi:hypothetical protein